MPAITRSRQARLRILQLDDEGRSCITARADHS